ncbi:outer membrane protein [Bordetella ansorpii]|uniref:Outer membrane protein n=1 Tax=Bordetella ansorpii TaxID=288768 RepID=A0A157KQW6_9BORD|nr:OmpW family outer membrane protein [Bordetella ansorpii]SAH86938.1 outer membrane protein [Bordetella ansorpii]
MNMKNIRIACVAALLALGCGNTLAAEGDILVRLRALHVAPDVSTNNTLSALDAGVKQSTVPELDLTYMFTDHIGAELILGVTRNRVTSNAGSLGKVSLLPPTLTLQYHFNPAGQFRPYVGAGINYTRFYDNSLSAGGQRVRIDRDSFGPALQLGMDIGLDDDWFMNVDVKKLWIRTDASLAGASLGTLKIDPWLVGVGIGRRF